VKFKNDRPLATPDAAERKLLELANAMEADHAGRLSVEIVNVQFRDAGGSYEEYRAAVKAAIAHGWIAMHPDCGPACGACHRAALRADPLGASRNDKQERRVSRLRDACIVRLT
jgi:hypothetical protein